jgi:mannan endo-1,4-beta-mannosidase
MALISGLLVLVAAVVSVPYLRDALESGSGGTARAPRVQAVDPVAAKPFYIVGSDIVGPDGNKFYPIGANVGMTSNFDWRGTAEGHVADAVAWGWNTVRLTIYCTSTYSFSIRKSAGPDALWAKIDSVVKEYTGMGIVVMIECHDAASNRTEATQFWTDAANRYKGNPYVWFNAENEPTWNDNAQWLSLQQHYLRAIRATGAENIFVADVQNSGNDAGWDGARPVYDPSMGPELVRDQCNVLFDQHEYGGVDDSIGAAAYWDNVHEAGLAMLVGEFGYKGSSASDAGAERQNLNGANSVFEVGPKKAVGMLWWHATHGDGYSLKASGNAFYADGGPGANLSPGGQRLWDIGHNPPALGRFTGSLSKSNCPSARRQ